jgi:hypothetical protein
MANIELEKKKVPHSPINFVSEPPKIAEQAPVTSFASYSGPIPPPSFLASIATFTCVFIYSKKSNK